MKVLVVGAGNMGASHAKAYHQLEGFEIAGIVTRSEKSRTPLIEELGGGIAGFNDFDTALAEVKPDVVSINTYPETHEEFATKALEAGAHVFMEKPIATTVEAAQRIVDLARAKNRKLVIGYILRVHPSWIKFIEIAQTLGNPLVMRMNLNQQSKGRMWDVHRNLMNSMSPIVDCGVHYVDVMCQMTRSKPIKVNAIGARLSDELNEGMYNYGQLQVTFENGSVGWYEAGWGPMMSETAFFVKDVVGPKGSVSIVADKAGGDSMSSDVDSHTKTESLLLHHAEQDADNEFIKDDELIDLTDEPDHDELCLREQQFLLNAIQTDSDLSDHMDDAVNSLKIVLAADQALKEGRTVDL
ncbi:Gfo/Idh/MocA family oxidoreductase [Verrucomicrobiales bacterium]|jgi:predicted dehydrogenase|nr:Gfo/Idh/MocA family oxidoreductase [Verrucomicrobiales bacterium]